jgi:CHAD domain-containing protein
LAALALRFLAPLDAALPDLRRPAGGSVRLADRTARVRYVDSPDRRLWSRGVTLAHRGLGDQRPGTWTLAVPVQRSGPVPARRRGEPVEVVWPGDAAAVPPEARRAVLGLCGRAELVTLVELETEEHRFALGGEGGSSRAELDDEVATVTAGPQPGRRLRRLDLRCEALGPEGEPMVALVVSELRQVGAEPTRADPLEELVDRPGPLPPLDAGSSLRAVVQDRLVEGLDRLLDHDVHLRLHATQPRPHDVHQTRVAARRLRSDLKTLRPALDPVWLHHRRDDLRWVGTLLGAVRDLDVLERAMRDGSERWDPQAGEAVLGEVRRLRADAALEVAVALTSPRYLDLVEQLRAGALRPPFFGDLDPATPASAALPGLVGAQWRNLAKRVRRAGERPSHRDLHRIRIGAKQLRYASEAAAPVIGKAARRTAKNAEAVQTVLGEHHDAVSAQEWLASAATEQPPGVAFAMGQAAEAQRLRQSRATEAWGPLWQDVAAKKSRRWLS